MTRIVKPSKTKPAKTRRRLRNARPRRVSGHGQDEAVIISADESRRHKGDLTGEALVAAMQASPDSGLNIAPERMAMPVRRVAL
jgi:hypothetical protein